MAHLDALPAEQMHWLDTIQALLAWLTAHLCEKLTKAKPRFSPVSRS